MADKELFGNSEQLDDSISRRLAIEALAEWHDDAITNRLNNLPPAQPTGTPLHYNGSDYAHGFADGYKQRLKDAESEIVRCKDCKHWKDSDGVYRRGINAESKCPVNIRAVYEGNFYCADAERKTDE